MASEAEISEISSLFERMIRNRDMSLFLPFMLSLSQTLNNSDPDHESETNEDSTPQRIIFVNPLTQSITVIDGASSIEELFNNLGSSTKNGQPPATKESIEAMDKIEIEEGDGGECVVCLEEFEVGGVVKEMPCKHRFHGKCIEKWLGIHGSCPVCRYQMPVDQEDDGKKREEEEGGERRRVGDGGGGNGEVWVSFSINRSRRNQDQDSSSNPREDDDDEVEN
ncbi:E3 ubiquitin-protein ligase MPSR1 [Medicago truncatula]|uniref:RING-type E3 ubiquitin transferase n=1 Tax=Medicago truncatula TaxID=3880 RepID=G7KGK8_MEDTR|nr:E3 ubiquitin-protein ligase MPSR1 [Medicago truncatula]AES96774.1 zinc finger, C3HC4 type (RING finger) protein [Medicago truncatula]